MREILFRGKTPSQDERFDDGEWVEGFYTRFNEKEHRIYSGYAETDCGDYYPDWCNVRPETVGQYTGLTDKNGKRIFEGDIIRFQKFKDEPLWIGVVVYENCLYIAKGVMPLSYEKREGEKAAKHGFEVQVSGINKSTIEVIGNIHDNPELMKGGAE